jgi:hypothetical protein
VAELRQAPDGGIAILSSERLSTLSPDVFFRLLDRLSDFDVSVVAVYRDPLSWTRSMWQEQVKHGNFGDYREFLFNELLLTQTAASSRFLSLLQALDDRKVPVSIYNFNRVTETHDSVVKFFASEVLNLTIKINDEARQTQGFSAEFVELTRALNMMNSVCFGRPVNSEVRVRLQKEFSGEVRNFFKSIWEPFFARRHQTVEMDSKLASASPLGRRLATLDVSGDYPFDDTAITVKVLNLAHAFGNSEIRDFCQRFLSLAEVEDNTHRSKRGL